MLDARCLGAAELAAAVACCLHAACAAAAMLAARPPELPGCPFPRAGVLYNATIVPCPVSLAVINMGLQEAKVECLFSEFVQLR